MRMRTLLFTVAIVAVVGSETNPSSTIRRRLQDHGVLQPSSEHVNASSAALDEGDQCEFDADCGSHGKCVEVKSRHYPAGHKVCTCNECWIMDEKDLCEVQQKSRIASFLLSFFVGAWGVDHFFVYGCGCNLGIAKLLTCGGCCIWACVDWILIAAAAFTGAYAYYYDDAPGICPGWS